MRIQDLHILPKFNDGWSYLYLEHCRIDQEEQAIAIHRETGKVAVPCANLSLLMLGPGVSITHAAVLVLSDHGCLIAWCGEEGVRFYASGMGETRTAANFLHQARMWADDQSRMQVVRRLYQLRFSEKFAPDLTLRQIRGLEGIRVREAYAKAAKETGVPWSGRNYQRNNWTKTDPVNRALSAANACLYGICHAAIISAGFSPTLGFIHTGRMLSFVYDVADIYKAEITIPVAFRTAATETESLERKVRIACRDQFLQKRLLKRIIPDIQSALMLSPNQVKEAELLDQDPTSPGSLWDPEVGEVEAGRIQPLDPDKPKLNLPGG
ncbi:MAG: type I-E CRISPR-associated endonuclease Cas1e [bacterium]|nr:type I-E CRISPR-associated endonuclease Cas1e [bacterium]